MRHIYWQAALAVTVVVLAFLALVPLSSDVEYSRCTGAPVVRLIHPTPDDAATLAPGRATTPVPDSGICNKAVDDRASVAAFAAVVGLSVTVVFALVAIFGNRPRTTVPAAA